jgi:hypothetical protein
MAVERVKGLARSPFGPGYERVDGVIGFAVDPSDPCNRVITDLDRAPRGADGRVRFEADFVLLEPAQPSGRLLVYVVNRGRYGLVPFSLPSRPPTVQPTAEIDPGDRFLLERGWSVLFCGWQWDVMAREGLLGLRAPLADVEPGDVLSRFVPTERHNERLLSHWPLDPGAEHLAVAHRPYPALEGTGRLTVRDAPSAAPIEVPSSEWRFSPDGERIVLESGFQPGHIYELTYRTGLAPVVGCGLLAVRDAAAHFGRDLEATFGFGISQTGRFLRQFLHDRMNATEDGRAAFDGLLPHVAGARRGQFNHRFAQPSSHLTPGFGQLPPFDTGALVERAGAAVKVIETNTASEYWRSDCSLTHTRHASVRQYLFSGAMHGPGVPAVAKTLAMFPGVEAANPLTILNYIPLLRAALTNLEAWVCDGIEPPPSRIVPTPVAREEVLERFASFPPALLPPPGSLPVLRTVDLGPAADQGIGRWPAVESTPITSGVSAVDADGNETEGVRLPEVSVPLATHTGWNPAAGGLAGNEAGSLGPPIDMLGSTIPFPRTAAEREASGDTRLSNAERYAGRDDYLHRIRGAAERLVAERLLLAGDIDLEVDLAGHAWDALTR